jgi:hypothetical protein
VSPTFADSGPGAYEPAPLTRSSFTIATDGGVQPEDERLTTAVLCESPPVPAAVTPLGAVPFPQLATSTAVSPTELANEPTFAWRLYVPENENPFAWLNAPLPICTGVTPEPFSWL